ncbi:hypothetical protein EGW08_015300, partial [Elysia chlorotica]
MKKQSQNNMPVDNPVAKESFITFPEKDLSRRTAVTHKKYVGLGWTRKASQPHVHKTHREHVERREQRDSIKEEARIREAAARARRKATGEDLSDEWSRSSDEQQKQVDTNDARKTASSIGESLQAGPDGMESEEVAANTQLMTSRKPSKEIRQSDDRRSRSHSSHRDKRQGRGRQPRVDKTSRKRSKEILREDDGRRRRSHSLSQRDMRQRSARQSREEKV